MKKYDVVAIWQLHKFCNFSCKYYFIPLEEPKNPANKDKDAFLHFLNAFLN